MNCLRIVYKQTDGTGPDRGGGYMIAGYAPSKSRKLRQK
nr:MAG TPA: hypothetical protein [Bacteriophage sp.]